MTINNGGTALSLTLREEGTLEGSGSVDVSGRVVAGVNENGPVFVPKSARCAVGKLAAN